jgi:uncharacterized membrane protein YccC
MTAALPSESDFRLAGWRDIAGPTIALLLNGLRLWAAVCLALYVAFWLELDNPSWAAVTAVIVCQPRLGASLRKGAARMVGTVVGGIAVVALAALFPENRVGFLLSLAFFCSACAFFAQGWKISASYGGGMAAVTAIVIASDAFGATGGVNANVFMLAVSRATEISIGIVSAGVVLILTDYGGARRRLANQFAAIAARIIHEFATAVALVGPAQVETRTLRHALAMRVVALQPAIDEALGESSDLRWSPAALQMAVDGLFAALSGWRDVANTLERLKAQEARADIAVIEAQLPPGALAPVPTLDSPWVEEPLVLHKRLTAAARGLVTLDARTPLRRQLADGTSAVLLGVLRCLDLLALLADPRYAIPRPQKHRAAAIDFQPALIAAARVFLTFVLLASFWIVTAWTDGALALTFATVSVIFFSPRETLGYAAATDFVIGSGITVFVVGIIRFVILPYADTYVGFSLILGAVLVPLGMAAATRWRPALITAGMAFFCILLAPANPAIYDLAQFYNLAAAMIFGLSFAAISFLLLPPLSTAARARHVVAVTLRDLRHVAANAKLMNINAWTGRLYDRLSVLPPQTDSVQLARVVSAQVAGTAIIRMRRIAPRFGLETDLEAALTSVARGQCAQAIAALSQLERRLAQLSGRPTTAQLRAQNNVRAIREALAGHADYFDWDAS